MKRTFLSLLLPLMLAALILAAGLVVPRRLLEQRQGEFTRETTQVPAGDVRPYGDDYENMKQSLLQSIALLQRFQGVQEDEVAEKDPDGETEAVREQLQAFLHQWAENIADAGDFVELLYDWSFEESYGNMAIQDAGDPESWLIYGQSYWYGDWTREMNYIAAPYQGVPLVIELATAPYDGPHSLEVLWEGLTAAYQEQCGLLFNEPTVYDGITYGYTPEPESNSDLKLQTQDFQARVESGEPIYDIYSAVSTDFAFRLQMVLSVYETQSGEPKWSISVYLTENN